MLVNGPEDLNAPYFTLKTKLEPESLAKASESLLALLSTKLKQSFRLMVTFQGEEAHFRLCLDASLWFDVFLRQYDLSKTVKIARDYVTNTRLQISPKDEAPFVIDYKESEKDKAFILCHYWPNCKYSIENCSEYNYDVYLSFSSVLISIF